ncbi:MAG: oxidoreductase, partial [Desulfocapsa sp.]
YMHLRHRQRALYLAVNKNTDELHGERIYHDPDFCEMLLKRVGMAIFSPMPPAKMHEDPKLRAAYKCKFCNFLDICHGGTFARINCRTCVHSTPLKTGGWQCEKFNKNLTVESQKKGCTAHLFIPQLVPGKQVDVNGDEGWVEYYMPNGTVWRDGTADKYKISEVVK